MKRWVRHYVPTMVLICSIAVAIAAVAQTVAKATDQRPGVDEFANDIQFYLVIIQVLFAILMSVIGYFIRQQTQAISSVGGKYDALYEKLLKEYATREDVVERVHGLRDAIGVHSTWIHILAHHAQVDLPQGHQASEFRRKEQ